MFTHDDKGGVAIAVAPAFPLVIGGAVMGVEVGYWRFDQVRLQQAADAAAYAGAVVQRANGSGASDAASAAASSNGYSSTTDTITVNMPSSQTPTDTGSVEAVISRTETPIFTRYFTSSPTVIRARATASFSTAANACILALSPSASSAVNFAGSSSLNLNACVVMSDSIASDSFNMQGASSASAPCIYAVGGASLGGSLDLTTCTSVKTAQPPVADPYGSLAMPSITGPCTNPANSGSLSAGHYCSMTLQNNVTLAAGVYVIDGGAMKVNANANVSGSGVTIYLVNGATLTMNGNSHIDLTAPTSGTYAGLVMINDRANSNQIKINGDDTSSMTGVIYAPASPVTYIGNFSGAGGCTQIVARTVSWSGNASFSSDCSAAGMPPVQVGSVVRLAR